MIVQRLPCWLGLPILLLTAACADGDWRVSSNACDEDFSPALYSWVDSMDVDNDNTINSDEFNAAFQDTVDDGEPANDPAHHGVFVVEAIIVHEVDEQLRVTRVPTARRDSDRVAVVVHGAQLVTHEWSVTDVLVHPRAAAL